MAKPANLYETDLLNFFHTIYRLGSASMPTEDLMPWMGWEKQTAGFWSDVHKQFFDATLDDGEYEHLLSWQTEETITLVFMDEEDTAAKDRSRSVVSILAEKQPPGRRKQQVVAE